MKTPQLLVIDLTALLELATARRVPGTLEAIKALESIARSLAEAVASDLGVMAGSAAYTVDDSETCGHLLVSLHELFAGQPLPAALAALDPGCEWASADDRSPIVSTAPSSEHFERALFEVELVGHALPTTISYSHPQCDGMIVGSTRRVGVAERIGSLTAAKLAFEFGASPNDLGLDAFGQSLSDNPAESH